MSNLAIGFTGLLCLLGLLMLRVPIGASLGLVSIAGIWAIRGERAALGTLGTMPYDFAANWTLSAIPMFLLMGAIAFYSGMTTDIFRAARMWLRRVPGGLAVATNFACAAFGAVSGSSVATTAAVGKLAIPEMLKLRYEHGLATSVVAASGTLGALIPPSLAFMVYGWYAEIPLAPLLIAGILPGLLTAGIYAAMIITRCKLDPSLAPEPTESFSARERWQATARNWPLPLLMLGVIGVMYSGVMTVTEAAAGGAAMAAVIAALRRTLTWPVLKQSLFDSARTMASLFFIVIGAMLLTKFMVLSGVPDWLAEQAKQASLTPLHLVLALTVVFLILGMFLDPMGIMLLTLPIVIPICREMKIDLIWMGVLVVKYVEIGLLTPPVGIHAFVVKSIAGPDVKLTSVFRGLMWFLAAEVLIMVLLVAFPSISTWLPSLMS
jgi:tripartite ATP-independent transporter DctM subunit